MPTGTMTTQISLAGIIANSACSRTDTGQISHEVTLPAGNAGALSTRTDDDTGVATVAEGHGITDADTVNVFWADGCRYGMTVSAYTGTTVTMDGGSGDNFPTQDTVIVVAAQVTINTDFDGDDVQMIAAWSSLRAHIDFQNDTPASLCAVELTATEAWSWVYGQGFTNPLTGDPVDTILASAGTAAETTLKIGVLYDSA